MNIEEARINLVSIIEKRGFEVSIVNIDPNFRIIVKKDNLRVECNYPYDLVQNEIAHETLANLVQIKFDSFGKPCSET